ncbi:hypothetical protein C8F01DRAFT_1293144 [Mycena amicta]|nr:hypothetical protein C8F01DRAFT_1293144 [Mycena amicta]
MLDLSTSSITSRSKSNISATLIPFMHHRGACEECKDKVVQNPSEPGDSDSELEFEDFPPASETLLALATTCKTFQEPALAALWREQNTLDNLVKCLPSNLWTKEEKDWEQPISECAGGSPGDMMLKMVGSAWYKELPQPSWERAQWYSRCVQTLSISDETHPSYGVLCAFRIALRHDGTLFPNLQTLRWISTWEVVAGYNFISDFHGPQLRKVELCVPYEELPDPNGMYSWPDDAVRRLSLPWEQLEHFSIETVNRKMHQMPLPSGCFNPVAKQLSTSLTSLAVDGLNLESLAQLSGLPNLRDLMLSSPTLVDLQPHYTVDLLNLPLEAPNLQEIDVRATEPMHKCIACSRGPRFAPRVVDLILRGIQALIGSQPAGKPMRVGPKAPVGLPVVLSRFCPGVPVNKGSSMVAGRGAGTALQNGVQTYKLTSTPSAGGVSYTIPAEHCKWLHTLTIVIDATSAPLLKLPNAESQGRICQHALQTLDVGASVVSKPSKIAQYLCSVFPSLHKLKFQRVSENPGGRGHPQPAEIHSKRWKQVAQLLPIISAARKDERVWADHERQVDSTQTALNGPSWSAAQVYR